VLELLLQQQCSCFKGVAGPCCCCSLQVKHVAEERCVIIAVAVLAPEVAAAAAVEGLLQGMKQCWW
jgi:hypothetical protein